MSTTHDVIVIGGGMAGASIAFELAADRRVLVLEVEEQPGYHATGRSAAAYIPSYGYENASLRHLTLASRDQLESPDSAFHDGSFLSRRGLLSLAQRDGQGRLRASYEALRTQLTGVEWVASDSLQQAVPLLREDYLDGAIFERDVFDIDVHGLHESYLKGLKHRGGACTAGGRVQTILRKAGSWQVDTATGTFTAQVVVNAAGAWADAMATLAGVATVGIQPLRRTAILVETSADTADWPLVMETGAGFYFKPDAGLLLVSPADETPSPPCDVAPEELDVAYAAHYAEQALAISISNVRHSWAGLRNFVHDRTPVIGFDADAPGFF